MNIATYAGRNLFRRRGRTILTLLAIAIGVLIFSAIRTAVHSWEAGAQAAVKDRLVSIHKVGITTQMPRRYIDDIRKVPGVAAASYAVWFGAKDPKKRTEFFAGFAVDHETWFEVMDEMFVEPAVLDKWKKTTNGAILGDVIAETLQVKVGSKLLITSEIYEGDWELEVVGIYRPLRKTADRNSVVFRWDYFNNDPRAAFSKDQIGWVISKIANAEAGAEVSRAIDKSFDDRDDQTSTMSERAFQLSFLGAFGAIFTAFDVVSLVILSIIALILANTIAMNVRERSHEYGVLRAIGFSPFSVLGFVIGEALMLGVLGGAIGVGLTALIINVGMGPLIEAKMAGWFPYFSTPVRVMGIALVGSALIAVLASIVPALLASRRSVTDALRRLD